MTVFPPFPFRFNRSFAKLSIYSSFSLKKVSEKKQSQIRIFDARQTSVRVALAATVLVALVFGWYSVRWQIGNMLAERTTPTDAGARDLARSAVNFAPGDPLANWLFINTQNSSASKRALEPVVRLAPFDFRWWIELGREREQAENTSEAEAALQKAVELAPNYTFPRWQLGNFYLRQNRGDDAFRELTKAAQSNSLYREQVFSIAWEYFEKDPTKLEQIAGGEPEVRADLAKFYAAKNRAEDSLRVWNSLADEEKQTNADGARVIARALYDKQSYRSAIEFVRQLDIEPDARAETVQNGGFEKPIGDAKDVYFGWKTSPVERMDVKLDPSAKHEGSRSLRVSFNGYAQPTLFDIYQTVTITPKARYRLSFWIKTENLKSGGAPNLEIFNITDSKNIASSAAYPIGTNDWQQIKVEFTAPENAEAVGLRTTRADCGENCPILGTFWYDGFRLERLK